MKKKMSFVCSMLILAVVAVFWLPVASQAGTIVLWQGSHIASNTNVDPYPTAIDYPGTPVGGIPFSGTTPFFAPENHPHPIYGGVRVEIQSSTADGAFTWPIGRVNAHATNDNIQFRMNNATGTTTTIDATVAGAYVWNVGAPGEYVELSSLVSAYYDVNNGNVLDTNNFDRRVIVRERNTDNWFVSSEVSTLFGGITLDFDENTTWASFDTDDFSLGAFEAATFTEFDMAGHFYTRSATGFERDSGHPVMNPQFRQFTIDAVLIPEPSTLLLLGLAGLALLKRRRV